jgi:hypothetical protein
MLDSEYDPPYEFSTHIGAACAKRLLTWLSSLLAVQSLCYQKEHFRWQGELAED